MKYRKKPIIIEAVQWTGDNISELCNFTDCDVTHILASGEFYIETLKGFIRIAEGDFVIKGVDGELYPCKPDIFEKTYEEVEE